MFPPFCILAVVRVLGVVKTDGVGILVRVWRRKCRVEREGGSREIDVYMCWLMWCARFRRRGSDDWERNWVFVLFPYEKLVNFPPQMQCSVSN
jgi:hypothetical protein